MTITEVIRTARIVCTDKELEALAHHLAGDTDTTIATRLGISRQAVHARIQNAIRKISQHTAPPEEAA